MKKLLFLLLAVLIIPFLNMESPAHAATYERQNERELLLFWQDASLRGSGLHRPYSTVQLSAASGEVVWEGKTDGRGAFELTLPIAKIDSQATATFTISAFDQFGTAILNASGAPDELTATLLPRRDPSAEDETELPPAAVTPTPASANSPTLTAESIHASAPEAPADDSWPLFAVILLSISGAGGILLGLFFLWKKYHVIA